MDHIEDVLLAIRNYLGEDLSYYTDSLINAFEKSDPVFIRKNYSEFFWHCASTVPGWLPRVVLANSTAESEGSSKLLSLWKTVNYNTEVEERVLYHAKDESRHSRIFLRLVQLAFPHSIDSSEIKKLDEKLTDIRNKKHEKVDYKIPEELLIDHLVQMNIGEIRTRLHMQLLAPVIHAFAPTENKLRVRRILEGLVLDEVNHIGYTAKLMESWAASGKVHRELIFNLYQRRLEDFNLVTIQETESAIHSFGQGRFPDLLEI
ncbi:hypothetical protein [Bacillus thuringiensis]|uniref:hypothetical protein n=1 Tax=Bacillus thuringiensis TaxID=1428 RepID=UPI000BFD78FB|nr:hypothetical protein [Bacillus thuringiensis]PGU19085.1 hypothetical protein COD23_08645 [Bacillus thuringiensis]